jgi:hypothetical protein
MGRTAEHEGTKEIKEEGERNEGVKHVKPN